MSENNYSDEITINVDEQWELEWWPWRLGISKKELLSAVSRVGPKLNKIKSYLAGRSGNFRKSTLG